MASYFSLWDGVFAPNLTVTDRAADGAGETRLEEELAFIFSWDAVLTLPLAVTDRAADGAGETRLEEELAFMVCPVLGIRSPETTGDYNKGPGEGSMGSMSGTSPVSLVHLVGLVEPNKANQIN